MKLRTQTMLWLIVGVLALVAAGLAALGIINAASFNQQLYQLRSAALQLNRNTNARTDLVKAQVALKNYIMVDEDARLQYPGEFSRYEQQVWNYLDERQSSPASGEAEQINAAMRNDLDAYSKMAWDDVFYMEEWDLDEAIRLSLVEGDPKVAAIETQLKSLSNRDVKDIDALIVSIESNVQQTADLGRWALILIAGLIICSVYVTNRITQPLMGLTNAVVAFESGQFDPDLMAPYLNRGGEMGQLARAVNAMINSITESNRLKEQFIHSASRFIPTQYVEFLEKSDITEVNLGDHVAAEMAVMFSDIRGFSGMSEKMSARENFDFINEYLKLVSPVIQEHEGFIVKFLGDGMMAIFPYGVDDAVQAGIEKQMKVKAFNAQLLQRGLSQVSVGVGIHCGPMMVGMIGEELRMQGDAFSDNVNLTSRLEGLNKFFGTSMIMSEDTLKQLKQPVAYKMRFLGKAVVKGRVTPLGLYEVYQGQPNEVVALKDATKSDFERGVELYAAGKLAEAREAFMAVQSRYPDDKTTQYYLQWCATWLERGLPKDWNGSIVMDEK